MTDFMADHFAQADATLASLKGILDQAGTKYVDVPSMFGRSIALGWGDQNFVLLSVAGPPNDRTAYLTCPIFKNVVQDRNLLLEQVNYFTWANPGVPIFLHDADDGWAVIASVVNPAAIYEQAPSFLLHLFDGIRMSATAIRQGMTQAGVVGQLWEWNPDDLQSLGIRSVT